MSREIKFRGYDPDTKRWYHGSYVRLERYSGYAFSQSPEEDRRRHEAEAFDDYILFTEMNDWGLETRKLRATVDRASVGQYTGLKDKNGVEIYEGDIISCMGGYEEGESELPGDVQFLDGSWYVISGSDSILLYEYDINSVIGNIYDDPESLKEVV